MEIQQRFGGVWLMTGRFRFDRDARRGILAVVLLSQPGLDRPRCGAARPVTGASS
jgi:hypothetical protein